jgi:membrane protein
MRAAMQLAKKTWQEFSQDDCFRMAAALSYYTIFSLPPLLVVIVSIAGLVVNDPGRVTAEIETEIESVIGAGGATQVREMIEAASLPGRGVWGTVVGLALLLFGATGVLVQLQAALNEAWDVKPDPQQGGIKNFVLKRLLSLGMLLCLAFLMLVSLVLSTMINGLEHQIEAWLSDAVSAGVLQAINAGVALIVFTLLFAAMFKFLPDARVALRHVWIGALTTGVLFVAGKFALGFYFAHSDVTSTYGSAGSLVLILLWVYYSGLILLLGAEFTQVWARRHGDRIEPEKGAVRVTESVRHAPHSPLARASQSN